MSSPIFSPAPALPRGPHRLSRDEVADSQRARLMAAFTELLAGDGYASITIGGLVRRAGVSRAAFYEHFADKEACLLAAYDRFAAALADAMAGGLDQEAPWRDFVDAVLTAYLGALERDRTAARAFILEMDAAGPVARARRRDAVHGFAALLAQRHAAIRDRDRRLGPLPDRAYLGLAFGVRELVREALDDDPPRPLTDLAPDIETWITAMVEGAAAARGADGRDGSVAPRPPRR